MNGHYCAKNTSVKSSKHCCSIQLNETFTDGVEIHTVHPEFLFLFNIDNKPQPIHQGEKIKNPISL